MPNLNIINLLSAVMEDVGAVHKGDQNASQGFSFRGVDAVVNAVSPALKKHGVVVVPNVRNVERSTVEVGRNRTPMGHVQVVVEYIFSAPDGSSLTCSAAGEAMDSGDKATPKAMSVAFRTALLQALCLPTDEPDPDATAYERTDHTQVDRAKSQVWSAWKASSGGEDSQALASDYADWSGGYPIAGASAGELDKYRTERFARPVME